MVKDGHGLKSLPTLLRSSRPRSKSGTTTAPAPYAAAHEHLLHLLSYRVKDHKSSVFFKVRRVSVHFSE